MIQFNCPSIKSFVGQRNFVADGPNALLDAVSAYSFLNE